jgi:hypothetical protein
MCLTKLKESLPIFDDIASGIRKLLDDSHPQYSSKGKRWNK